MPKLSPEKISSKDIEKVIIRHLRSSIAHDTKSASKRDWWIATCFAVREVIFEFFSKNREKHYKENSRRVYYFSLEYLMGKRLGTNLHNAQLFEKTEIALKNLGQNINEICDFGPDMALGNGGLGRLATCFLDSLSSLGYPALGYGIHYEFGIFRQEFQDGKQIEFPDEWVKFGNPWETVRPEYSVEIGLYGKVHQVFNDKGVGKYIWKPEKKILGVPIDVPIVGYGINYVNLLRLWEAKASSDFNLQIFNDGGYGEAVKEKVESETISKVLYPNDSTESGRELRFVQQYFFVSCSLHDIIRRFKLQNKSWEQFPKKVAIQLNDTHPAIAIVELMRIFIDIEGFSWDKAWGICQKTFSYTNHTLLPEALERWSVALLQKVVPRHLQIIYEINRIFLAEEVQKKWPQESRKVQEMSIIEEGYEKMVRMAYLSVVGSHSTNGVAEIHTQLLKTQLFKNFHELYPTRFNNKTNGITPRCWLLVCNPKLAKLVTEKVGEDWPTNLDKISGIEKYAKDSSFQKKFMAIKHENKINLAKVIKELCHIEVSPDAIFDVQIKRLHEYKRQHLCLLHILALYRRLINGEEKDFHPRVFIFGAKAAPGYLLAKEIIHAINSVGNVINNDERINGLIKVAFLPNYSISLAEKIIPASDVSEQISTAGKEASGTGNMKLALNGALTIGTLDGANIEIKEEVGEENIFIFGKTVEEVQALKNSGYNPYDIYFQHEELRAVIDWLGSGYFNSGKKYYGNLINSLLDGGDPYLVLADYQSYSDSQRLVGKLYKSKAKWAEKAILNTARVGKFSSDRTIKEYADDIWKMPKPK